MNRRLLGLDLVCRGSCIGILQLGGVRDIGRDRRFAVQDRIEVNLDLLVTDQACGLDVKGHGQAGLRYGVIGVGNKSFLVIEHQGCGFVAEALGHGINDFVNLHDLQIFFQRGN